jgi:very-short-patch-repair endonuclease
LCGTIRPVDGERLRRLARRQFGVFTRAQARECGFTPYQVRRRIADGEWQVVLGRSLAFAELRITPLVRDRAAQLSIPGSILGGASAARTWQIPVPDDRPCLYVGRHGGTRLAGVRLIYASPDPKDVSLFQGLPTVGKAAAIVDCLQHLPEAAATTLLDRALQRRWIDIEDLARRIRRRTGRVGSPKLTRLLAGVRGGERSTAERRFTGLLRRAGIGGWRANVAIHDDRGLIGEADVAFIAERLVIEIDGWAFHTTPERFQRDRARQNRLVAAGWTVVRFTWKDLTDRPDYVLATVAALLGARGAEQA